MNKIISGSFVALITAILISSCSSPTSSTPAPVTPPVPVSSFNIGYLSSSGGVSFTNTSTNASSYSWDFGDGTTDDYLTSPTKYYSKNGTYNVMLTATGSGGSANSTQTVTIDNVPFMTADITGSGTFPFEATSVAGSKNSNAISVTGIASSNQSLMINLPPNPVANTSYDISLGYPVGFVYTSPQGVLTADSQTPRSTGNILVTYISSTEIRGTFSAVVVVNFANGSGGSYTITNGTFYYRF